MYMYIASMAASSILLGRAVYRRCGHRAVCGECVCVECCCCADGMVGAIGRAEDAYESREVSMYAMCMMR